MSTNTSGDAAATFKAGDYVYALWQGKGREYEAFVDAVNDDGTYKVLYVDGDYSSSVKPEFMRLFADHEAVETFKCPECDLDNHNWRKSCSKCKTGNPNKKVASYSSFGWGGGDWHLNAIQRAEQDCAAFLNGYPGQKDNKSADINFRYFSNKLRMQPDGYTIEEFQKGWWGKYDALESGHSFVQWIFPIREQGLNPQAQPLQKWEADAIAADPALQGRLIQNYRLMLDFYGMKLVDETTGEIARTDDYVARYDNLERCSHNFLRITRILKCLAECGLERYQVPFVTHVFKEIFENQQLECCEQAARMYWVNCVKDATKREELKAYALKFREIPKEAKRKPWAGYSSGGSDFSSIVRPPRTWDVLPGHGSPLSDLSVCKFGKEQKVRATWQGKTKLYLATVKAINLDGTYRLQYSDGDVDDYVPENQIQAIPGEVAPPAAAATTADAAASTSTSTATSPASTSSTSSSVTSGSDAAV